MAQNRVNYRSSLKGTYQLVLDGFPYSRHRIRGCTIYWRCVQFRPLKCVLNSINLNSSHLSVCIHVYLHIYAFKITDVEQEFELTPPEIVFRLWTNPTTILSFGSDVRKAHLSMFMNNGSWSVVAVLSSNILAVLYTYTS